VRSASGDTKTKKKVSVNLEPRSAHGRVVNNDVIIIILISNSNWTEWITIHRVIRRVISESDEEKVRRHIGLMVIVHLTLE